MSESERQIPVQDIDESELLDTPSMNDFMKRLWGEEDES